VALVAFAIAFAVGRALAGDGSETEPSQPQPRSYEPVTIDNLERVPQIKPLRSAPGAPPPAATAEASE
jgi:hypothetical protein